MITPADAMLPRAALDVVSEAAGMPVNEPLRARILSSVRMRRRIAMRMAGGQPLALPLDEPGGRLLAEGSEMVVSEVLRAAGALACAEALRRVVDGARVRTLHEAIGERGWTAAMTTEDPGREPCPGVDGLETLGRAAMLDWLRARPDAERATLALRLSPEDRAALEGDAAHGDGAAFATAAALFGGPDAAA